MEAKEVTLKQLLDGPCSYVAPSFQRPYDWRGDAVRSIVGSTVEHTVGGHFLGAVVLMDIGRGSVQKKLVIDGNHRLMTVLITMLAVRDELSKFNKWHFHEINRTCFLNDTVEKNRPSLFKTIAQIRDRNTFESLVLGEAPQSKSSPVMRVYKFAGKAVSGKSETMLVTFRERLLFDFSFVSIDLRRDEDPYPLFKLLSVPDQEFTQVGLRKYNRFSDDPEVMAIVAGGESQDVEFKERTVGAAGSSFSILRAVAGFMNSKSGGTLLIGVRDDGTFSGVESEYSKTDRGKSNRDGYLLYLNNMLRTRLDTKTPFMFFSVELRTVRNHDVCMIRVKPSAEPVYLDKHLFVRSGNQTIEILGPDLIEYVSVRWPHT